MQPAPQVNAVVRPLRYSPSGVRIGGERVMRKQRKIEDQLARIDKHLANAEADLTRNVNVEGSPISPVLYAGRKD